MSRIEELNDANIRVVYNDAGDIEALIDNKGRALNIPLVSKDVTGGIGFNVRESVIPAAITAKLSALGLNIRVMFFDAPGLTKTYGWLEWVAGGKVTPESLFDFFSVARSAPTNTYHVGPSGNDSTGNGTSGTPYRTINKAITVGNAAVAPFKVLVSAGAYSRLQTPAGNTSTKPTQDCAIIASGGRVVVGSWDDYSAPSADVTYTNTYSFATTNVDRVLDLTRLDRFGKLVELRNVPTAARCNVTPDSWALVSGTLYVNRSDGAAVTNANTRVLRQTGVVQLDGAVNVFFGGASGNDGFDFMGGQASGLFDAQTSSPSATAHAIVAANSTFRFAGGVTGTSARAANLESINGVCAFFNCGADAAATDGYNLHNTNSAASAGLITVNCTGYDNGRGTQTSCNGWTNHDISWGLDVAGDYQGNHGGTARSVNAAVAHFAGAYIADDMGDITNGGSIPPTAFRVDDTAEYWLDGCRVKMPAGGYPAVAYSAGSKIHLSRCQFGGLPSGGVGTVDTF